MEPPSPATSPDSHHRHWGPAWLPARALQVVSPANVRGLLKLLPEEGFVSTAETRGDSRSQDTVTSLAAKPSRIPPSLRRGAWGTGRRAGLWLAAPHSLVPAEGELGTPQASGVRP